MITKESVVAGVGCSPDIAELWFPALQKACEEFSIDTPEKVAAFLTVIGTVSDRLSSLVENTDYSASQLSVMWPFKYALDSHVDHKIPNALALVIGGKPEKIANNIYAQRLGNGREGSGDGWRFRGRGPLRLCGRAAFAAFWARCKLDPSTDPATLEQPENGALSAAFVFEGSWKKVVESGAFESKLTDHTARYRYVMALPILTKPPEEKPETPATPTTPEPSAEDVPKAEAEPKPLSPKAALFKKLKEK